MEQQIRFFASADGTRIAYATYSDRTNEPLVMVNGWGYSQQPTWEGQHSRPLHERLGGDRMLITYDRRGVGASERNVAGPTIEQEIADLAALADHLQLVRFDIFSYEPFAAGYAAQYPDRVRRLVLASPYASGQDTEFPQIAGPVVDAILRDWPIARRAMASFIFPTGPVELQRWYSNMLRDYLPPPVAAAQFKRQAELDLTDSLPLVQAPTLVIHPKAFKTVPVAAAQRVAALIPNARFLAVEGDLSVSQMGLAEIVVGFLDEDRAPNIEKPAAAAVPDVVTVLFVDITDSTALTQRLGDARAQVLVREHNAIVREALAAHRGNEIKHTGDGIMASFATASSALECAIAVQRAVEARAHDPRPATHDPLAVHIGLNAGEPLAEEGDIFGTSVQLARRICDAAGGGEILASDVVRQLAAGKGFLFADRGEHPLRGFEDPVQLYEVRWRE